MADALTPPLRGLPEAALPVPPVPADALPEQLSGRLAPRLERLGYLGAFFGYGAHQPDALAGFIDFTEALKRALPADLAEVVALTVAHRLGSTYELAQHERLAARTGLGADWVTAVLAGPADGSDGLLSPRQAAASELVRAVLADGGHGARAAVERAAEVLDGPGTIAVLLLTGRCVAHAHVANALELTDPTGPVPGHRKGYDND